MAKPKEVTDATFDTDVLSSERPIMVDLWAPWCGPCHMVSPLVEELADEYGGRINFAKLDVDENPITASRYNIRAIPTLLVFNGGSLVDQIVGFRPKADLRKRLDNLL
jgi:thioredoxin 1